MDLNQGNISPGPKFDVAAKLFSSMESLSVVLQESTDRPSVCKSVVTVSFPTPSKEYPTGYEMKLATAVPPQPDAGNCQCMMDSIMCVANHTFQLPSNVIMPLAWKQNLVVPEESWLNQSLCATNQSWCLGSQRNTETGQYGAFSMCNSTERGSWILNRYFNSTNGDHSACTSAGGIIRETGLARPLSPSCSAILRQAGPLGTGNLTAGLSSKEYSDGKAVTSGRRLSTADIAGIGSGILIFLVSLCTGVYLIWRRRQLRRTKKTTSGDIQPSEFEKAGFSDNGSPESLSGKLWYAEVGEGEIVESAGSERVEAGHDGEVFELPLELGVVELDASPRKLSHSEARHT
jgi:hypothetical protein